MGAVRGCRTEGLVPCFSFFLDLKQKWIPNAASRGDLDEEPPLHGITQQGTYSGAMGYKPYSIDRAHYNGSGLSDLEHGPIVQSKRISLVARDYGRHSTLRHGGLSILGTGTRQRVNGRGTWESWNAARHLAYFGHVAASWVRSLTPCQKPIAVTDDAPLFICHRSAGISCMTIATQGRMFTEAVHNNEITL